MSNHGPAAARSRVFTPAFVSDRLLPLTEGDPPELPDTRGYADLLPTDLTDSAVLVLVIDSGNCPRVVLNKRTDSLRHHAGQISFPGGRREPDDRSLLQTALRETNEELGIPCDVPTIIGRLDPIATITGFLVAPFVGWTHQEVALRPDPVEVADAFTVPLDYLLDLNNYHTESAMFRGRKRHYSVIHYEGHRIWGATAQILINLRERLRE